MELTPRLRPPRPGDDFSDLVSDTPTPAPAPIRTSEGTLTKGDSELRGFGDLVTDEPPAPQTVLGNLTEFVKGLVPGAVNTVGSGIAGLSNFDPVEIIATDIDKMKPQLSRIPQMKPDELEGLRGEIAKMPSLTRRFVSKVAEDIAAGKMTVDDLMKMRGPTPVADRPLTQVGGAVEDWSHTLLPATPGYEASWGRVFGEGLGSTLGGVGAAIVNPGLAAALFTAGGSREAQLRAQQGGATPEQQVAAGLAGAFPGYTDVLPIEMLLYRLPVPVRSAIGRAIGRIGVQATIEGVQEGGQQFLQNLIAKEIYNPAQDLGEDIVPNTAVGGGVGALAETLMTVAEGVAGHRGAKVNATRRPQSDVPAGATNADELYPENAPALGTTPMVPATGHFEQPAPAQADFTDLVTDQPPVAAKPAAEAPKGPRDAFEGLSPDQLLGTLKGAGYSDNDIANMDMQDMRQALEKARAGAPANAVSPKDDTAAQQAVPLPRPRPEATPVASESQPEAPFAANPSHPSQASQPAAPKPEDVGASANLADLVTNTPAAPADDNVVAATDVQAGDSNETVRVQITKKGPWDFNDSYPAPDQATIDAIRREGRPTVYDGEESDDSEADRVHGVRSTMDESLNELQSLYSGIAEAQSRISAIETGKLKTRKDPQAEIKRLRQGVANAQRSIDEIGSVYESEGFSEEATAAMRTEAQNRADSERKSSPPPAETPKATKAAPPAQSTTDEAIAWLNANVPTGYTALRDGKNILAITGPGGYYRGFNTSGEAVPARDLTRALKDIAKPAFQKPSPKRGRVNAGVKSGDRLRDWSNTIIPNYDERGQGGESSGGPTKDAFLADARNYLSNVAKALQAAGFGPHTGKNGKAVRPVAVNPGGPAVSGDVHLAMRHPDGRAVHVSVGTTLAGPKGGISIVARQASHTDSNGRGANQWLPVDLTVEQMAERLQKIAGEPVKKLPESQKSPQATPNSETGAEEPKAAKEGDDRDAQLERASKMLEAGPVERIEFGGTKHTSVRYHVEAYAAPEGGFAHKEGYQVPGFGGRGGPPSYESYPTKEAALIKGLESLKPSFESVLANNPSTLNQKNRAGVEKALAHLNAQLDRLTPSVAAAKPKPKTPQVPAIEGTAPLGAKLAEDAAKQGAGGRVNAIGFFNSMASLTDYLTEKLPKGYVVSHQGKTVEIYEGGKDGKRIETFGGRPALVRVDSILAELGKEPEPEVAPTPVARPDGYGASNKLVTAERADELRAKLKAKLKNQVSSGIDPEILAIGAELTAFHIEAGARKFADLAHAIAKDLGVEIGALQRYLRGWYNGARDMMEDAGLDVGGMDGPDAVREALKGLVTTTGKNDEPQQLEERSPTPLAGEQPAAVQGAQPGGQTGKRAGLRGRANAPRNVEPGKERGPDAGSVGEDEAGIPLPASDEVESAATPAAKRSLNYVLSDADALGEGGAKTKFNQNIAAIKLLRDMGGGQATPEQQAVLAKYVGWGGLKAAFPREDGTYAKGWEDAGKELRALLPDAEYKAARASTQNAHYTSPPIVKAMWFAVQRLGFRGGRVLEPAVGTGNFLGFMPTEVRDASQVNAVELDRLTGVIAKQLYPHENIQTPVGFQDFTAPDGWFDLAIGNPPFGAVRVYDERRKKISRFTIHNFFFAKSVDLLREDGVLAMVVTNFVMDASRDSAREYIASKTELLGAIRLPNNAFAKSAGTEVTTDIIFLRKLKKDEKPTGESWMDAKVWKDKEGREVLLNEYYVRHPEQMLGEFGAYGTMYAGESAALIAREGQNTEALVHAAIARLPQNIMPAPGQLVDPEKPVAPHNAREAVVGSMFLSPDGMVWQRRDDIAGEARAEPVDFESDRARDRVKGMIRVRDAFAELRRAQLDEAATDAEIAKRRKALNTAYDGFVAKQGPINLDANKRVFRDDPTWPQISALEESFDRGISAAVAKNTGEKPREPSATKAPVFTKRTQSPYRAPTTASSAKDALAATLVDLGRVDMPMMERLYGHGEETIVRELGELLFKNPVGGYETRDHYLSGNVKQKLAIAEQAVKKDAQYARNVEALKAAIPPDIEAIDISVKPGAHWLPPKHVGAFADHILEHEGARALYVQATAAWILHHEGKTADSAETRYGTDRAYAKDVLTAAVNGRTMSIYDRRADGSSELNRDATDAANAKVELVKDEWKRWVWAEDTRRAELHRLYNDSFNTDRKREYDGSHLTFPGKVGDDIIRLRPHQASMVWRIVQSGTALLDHVVGAGKTFTMVSGAMELRRMGLARKPMFVVPNHLVGQWASDFLRLYPGAKILAATKKDFEADNRKRLFARVATGDYDAVIVAHSSFGKIAVDPAFAQKFLEEQIADIQASIDAVKVATGEKKNRTVAQLEKARDNLRAKWKRLLDSGAKDDNLTFQEMGVDALFVDEAHEFKNLAYSTSMTRVLGLGNQTGSQKAADLYVKIQSVLERTGGRNVVFATGTPISNTMAEMFTMQRYLDHRAMKDMGLAHFDAWARMFGEVVNDWELNAAGKYKLASRFSKFVNMPELMQRYLSFSDVIVNDDIRRQLAARGETLPLPKVKGGKPQNVVVERSHAQASFIGIGVPNANGGPEDYPKGTLIYRSENLPKGPPQKGDDNMLAIMSDARKAALDMRLIDPALPDVPGSKVHVAADNITRIYKAWHAQKGAQLVFIDLSTPKGAKAKEAAAIRELVKKAEEGDEAAQEKVDAMSPDEFLALDGDFSVYDDLRQKLINRGIPANEIAYIHDANTELQKDELFGKVRSGRIRVLLGSTPKMGAGMNVQNRLVALHHLDAPWRPSDLEQREGRIIRQGNTLYLADPDNFEVEVLRYATKNTLDARMWQTIEGKARFIEQVRKGDSQAREIEDVAGEAANAAEMKAAASGNPLILEEMDLRQQLRKLDTARYNHDREQYRIRDLIKSNRNTVVSGEKQAAIAQADADAAASIPTKFAMTIAGEEFEKPKDAGAAIIVQAGALKDAKGETMALGAYGPFKLRLRRTTMGAVDVQIIGKQAYEIYIPDDPDPTGLAMRIRNGVAELTNEPDRIAGLVEKAKATIPALEAQVADWPNEAKFKEVKARHEEVLAQLRPKPKPAPNADTQGAAKSGPSDSGSSLGKRTDKVPPVPGVKLDARQRRNLERRLRSIVKHVAGKDVDVSLESTIDATDAGDASYNAAMAQYAAAGGRLSQTAGGLAKLYPNGYALIRLAVDDPTFDPTESAWHESYHRVEAQLMTDAEFAAVNSEESVASARAMAAKVLGRDPNGTEIGELPGYEARAIAFEGFVQGAEIDSLTQDLRRFFIRLRRLLRQIKAMLTGQGYLTLSDVFEDVYQGRMADRQPGFRDVQAVQLAKNARGAQTTTPAFKAWFGKSKIVNKDGTPRVVYHGTDADFSTYLRTEDIGFHFGDAETANRRVLAATGFEVTRDEPSERAFKRAFNSGAPVEGSNVMPVYLRMEKPLRLPDLLSWEASDVLDALVGKGVITPAQYREIDDSKDVEIDRIWVRDTLAKKGYDGIVYPNAVEGTGDSYIVFNPQQVKSATGNRGTFSLKNASILGNAAARETPAFRKWFEGSKVVDGEGKPLRVYHGTDASFDAFDKETLGRSTFHPTATLGFWFSESAKVGDLFTQSVDDSTWPPKLLRRPGANIVPAYLSIKKPYRMSVEQFRNIQAQPFGEDFEREQPEAARSTRETMAHAKARLLELGYDGIHIPGDPKYADHISGEEYSAGAWVAFEPTQIKSATGNRGTFDPNAGSILGNTTSRGPKETIPWKGSHYWAVAIDKLDGAILAATTNKHAADADFHHHMYLPPSIARRVDKGDVIVVWETGNGLAAMDKVEPELARRITEITGRPWAPLTPAKGPTSLGSVIPHDAADPFAEGGAEARRTGMLNGIQIAPFDRAARIPFDIFGGLDRKGEWKPGQFISRKAGHIITEARFADSSRFHWLNGILHRARAGLVDRYGLSDEYVQRERKRALDERGILSQVPEIMQALKARDVGPAEAKVLQAILTGERTPTEQWKGLSEPIREAIDDFGAEAVELGLVSAESYERNRGAYLHRVYLKHETDQSSLQRWIGQMRSSRRKRIIGDELKGRGLFKTVPVDRLKDADGKWPRDGAMFRIFDRQNDDGQVIERKYLRAGEAAPDSGFIDRGEWEVRGRSGGQIVLWRDYTKAERTRMGEITDARYTIAKTYMLIAHDLSVGRFYRDIAQNKDWTRDSEPMPGEGWAEAGDYNRHWADPSIEWVRVPDTKIPKSNTFRYAALAGKYVRAEIWRDLHELEILNKAQTWQKLVTMWKVSKTALSPVVHMNNVMSNVLLMDMSGVGAFDLVAGLKSLVSGDALYQEAESFGAFGADMATNEIRKTVLEPALREVERELQGGQGQLESRIGAVGKLLEAIYRVGKAGADKMIDLYRVEDEVFRMALYARRRAQGIEPQEAADEARQQFIDYDIRAPWVNFVRRTFPILPFIAYTYRAVPLVAHTVMTRPWKIAKYFAVAYALNALAYMLFPGDEDKERRSMQPEEQGYTWIGAPRQLRLPFGDKYGNPTFLDIRRWIPAGDIFDLGQSQSGLPIPAPLQFGGPLMMGAELFLNRDAFTGQDIVNTVTDDAWDKTAKITDWAWKQIMPSAAFIPGSYYWTKVANAVKGARDWQGKPFDIPSALVSSLGVKASPQDVQEGFRIWGIEFNKVDAALKSEMGRLARDRARGMISAEEFDRQRGRLIAKMQNLDATRRRVFAGK